MISQDLKTCHMNRAVGSSHFAAGVDPFSFIQMSSASAYFASDAGSVEFLLRFFSVVYVAAIGGRPFPLYKHKFVVSGSARGERLEWNGSSSAR